MGETIHSVDPGFPTAAFPQTSTVILYLCIAKDQDFRPCKTTHSVTVLCVFKLRQADVTL